MENFGDKIIFVLMFIPILAFHEAAHAWVAHLLGDDTAKNEGRMTLNPIVHIDPIGTLLIPGASLLIPGGMSLIGWGKPVPVDDSYFRHRRRDDTLVALAGPAANIVLATLALLAIRWLPSDSSFIVLGERFALLAVFLAVFNMIPIPPLDGWHLLKNWFRISDEVVARGGLWWFVLLMVVINLPPVMGLMQFLTEEILRLLAMMLRF